MLIQKLISVYTLCVNTMTYTLFVSEDMNKHFSFKNLAV